MARTWISAESRARLRHRQHLAELDAQNRRPRYSKVDYQRQQREERIKGLLELRSRDSEKP